MRTAGKAVRKTYPPLTFCVNLYEVIASRFKIG